MYLSSYLCIDLLIYLLCIYHLFIYLLFIDLFIDVLICFFANLHIHH